MSYHYHVILCNCSPHCLHSRSRLSKPCWGQTPNVKNTVLQIRHMCHVFCACVCVWYDVLYDIWNNHLCCFSWTSDVCIWTHVDVKYSSLCANVIWYHRMCTRAKLKDRITRITHTRACSKPMPTFYLDVKKNRRKAARQNKANINKLKLLTKTPRTSLLSLFLLTFLKL